MGGIRFAVGAAGIAPNETGFAMDRIQIEVGAAGIAPNETGIGVSSIRITPQLAGVTLIETGTALRGILIEPSVAGIGPIETGIAFREVIWLMHTFQLPQSFVLWPYGESVTPFFMYIPTGLLSTVVRFRMFHCYLHLPGR